MQNYYFAGVRLKVYEDDFLKRRLFPFTKEKSYISEISLHINHDLSASFDHADTLYTDSSIKIYSAEGGGWVIAAADRNNYCYIRTNSDYCASELSVDETGGADKIKLEDNILQILRLSIESNFAYHGGISLHSSCVAYDNNAVLFTAPSGTGKSTHAKIWEDRFGAEIINGDRPCLRVCQSEISAYGVPWDGKEQIYRQDNYPVAAIVEIRRAKENSIRKLSEAQAFKLLMKQVFIPAWDDTAKFFVLETIKTISEAVAFYRLFCLPDTNAAEAVKNVIFSENPSNSLSEGKKYDMRIKDGFILKNIVDEWIVMPKGNNVKNFESAIVLNEVAAFIWKQLENPISREDLLKAVLNEYDVDEKTAANDINSLIGRLIGLKILEQEA